jgi:hypothetical protein
MLFFSKLLAAFSHTVVYQSLKALGLGKVSKTGLIPVLIPQKQIKP